MALIGIDYGLKRIGIAFSSATIAFPGPVITGSEDDCIAKIIKEAQSRGATEIVIGLPRNMDGSESEMSARVAAFAEKIRAATKIPVITWDERLTSVQADRAMLSGDLSRKKRKEKIDSMSAQIMLQSYIDSKAKRENK